MVMRKSDQYLHKSLERSWHTMNAMKQNFKLIFQFQVYTSVKNIIFTRTINEFMEEDG